MKKIENSYRLNRSRSIAAFIISVAIMAIVAVVVVREVVIENDGYAIFRYFTTVSNILAAYAAILTVPYAIDGMFKQRYRVSKQITSLLFCGTLCVTITMLLALCVLLPGSGMHAIVGYNFWCHIVCPILIIILFGLVSNEQPVSIGDSLRSTVPFLIYIVVYTVMVLFIGEENGGWDDMYAVLDHLPPLLAIILAILVVFAISLAFRWIHNARAKQRWNKMVQEITQRYKPEEGADVRFMLYEMGELMGAYDGKYEVVIPIQLLQILSRHYTELSFDEMVNIFVKGALNSIK